MATVLAITPVHAASAAPDPTKHLREQFASGHGVVVKESARTRVKGIKGDFIAHTTGVIGFTSKNAANYDLVSNYTSPLKKQKQPQPIHAIKMGGATYLNGFTWRGLPEGKTWTRFRDRKSWGENGQRGDQLMDVLDPKFLRIVIDESTKVEPGVYQGALDRKTLEDDWKWSAYPAELLVKLYLDKSGLPTRLITAYSERSRGRNRKGKLVTRHTRVRVDTRYTDWGANVDITTPPAEDVADYRLPKRPAKK
ncbi:hypothetical protein ACIBHX_42070 [Nonomuraea sp. NPDC050536]|uniref:hypothetical protein n=1 Tax=Nonomuraea sp. NPDC050536 TaxID=3364366 RepID=UPI0037C56FA2